MFKEVINDNIIIQTTKLSDAPALIDLRIVSIDAGADSKKRLSSMGLHVNDVLIRITNAKWGPILIQNNSNSDSKVALGRGMAEKIIVEYK